MKQIKKIASIAITFILLSFLFSLWTYLGLTNFNLNADLSRDMSEISSLYIGKMLWLGPHLRVGFPASPIYYYIHLPILILTGGSAYSLVITQTLIAISALLFFHYSQKSKGILGSYLGMLLIGLSNWWINSTINPWNGYMYVSWIMLAFISLWTRKRLWLSSLFLGIAIAIHPASLMVIPILIYETIVNKTATVFKKIVFFLSGIFLPWLPIIAFEVITKGYLFRQWTDHKSTGMSFEMGLGNIHNLFTLFALPKLFSIILVAYSIYLADKKTRRWYLLTIPTFIFLYFISTLHIYYLLPLVAILFFLISKTLSKTNIGKVLLMLCIIIFSTNILRKYSFDLVTPTENRYKRINSVVDKLIEQEKIVANDSYALISVIDSQNSTPQADDYRFLLRTKGYISPNIDTYPTADYLFIFFENNQENPEEWHDWHTEHFGQKELMSSETINNITVVKYIRK